jgi:Mg-chelatase subunit ChlD
VRLLAPLPREDVRSVEFPGRIEILEQPTGEDYRSVLGEWGYTVDRGPYEWLVPSAVSSSPLGPDAGDSAADATALSLGETRVDRAEILVDEDWYRLEVPADANTLRLDVEGVPTVGVTLTLFDAAGGEQELRPTGSAGAAVRYEAIVEPGAAYDLRVQQPPFNVVFTFDTSGSMGPYLDFVLEGMRVFASDVEPGREQALIIPFDRPPLLRTWSDQPVQLEAAVNEFVPADESSNIERGLQAGASALLERDGTRAILAVGDAETGTLNEALEVWGHFGETGPVVYTVHVGADSRPLETRNLMRAWSDVNGGVYRYPTTHAETERAFERMSTRLRRPATYALRAEAVEVDRRPGTLAVVAPPDQAVGLASDTGIGIVLDTSGSMREKLEGKTRIAIAKASLRELLGETLAEGTPVAIRTLGPGGKAFKCQSRLEVPLAPLDRKEALRWIKDVRAPRKAGTPLTDALLAVPDDMEGVGNRIVLVITDGNESCGGDPLAAVAELERGGISAVLNIVGFALDDDALRTEMSTWAEAGGGSYYDAASADELLAAIVAATGATYEVTPAEGGPEVANGSVGGGPVEVPPGAYRVEVRTEPPIELDGVVVDPGANVSLELPATE